MICTEQFAAVVSDRVLLPETTAASHHTGVREERAEEEGAVLSA